MAPAVMFLIHGLAKHSSTILKSPSPTRGDRGDDSVELNQTETTRHRDRGV